MWNLAIPAITSLVGKAIDKAVPDKDQADKLKHDVSTQIMNFSETELKASMSIIVAEAQSGQWLAANWRPITMLTFVGLIVAHWLGWTSPNLSEAQVLALLEIVKIGLGGYVVGRSVEKAVKTWKGN